MPGQTPTAPDRHLCWSEAVSAAWRVMDSNQRRTTPTVLQSHLRRHSNGRLTCSFTGSLVDESSLVHAWSATARQAPTHTDPQAEDNGDASMLALLAGSRRFEWPQSASGTWTT